VQVIYESAELILTVPLKAKVSVLATLDATVNVALADGYPVRSKFVPSEFLGLTTNSNVSPR
jgi:hypothetical protein